MISRHSFRFLRSVAALTAVTLGSLSSAPADEDLLIVSPHWEGVQYEFGRAFTSYCAETLGQKVHVHWRDLGGTSQIEKAIDAAYRVTPDSCQIDLLFGGGMDPYENLKRKHQLQPCRLPDNLLAQIPATVGGVTLRDPDDAFYGAALSSFGIVENVRIIQRLQLPPVTTWEDLAQPELFGWVSSAEPRKSGSIHLIYEIILQAYGWERGWAAIYQTSGNVRSFLPASAGPTKEVSAGDAAYALSIDINGLTQQTFLGPENVRFHIPPGLSVVNPDGIAILKGAPHLALAQEFLRFVLSERGQSLWMKPFGSPLGAKKYPITRMGVWPGMYADETSSALVPIHPFQTQNTFTYNGQVGSRRWAVLNDLIGQTVIDVHPHLRRAWAAVLSLPPLGREALKSEFSQPMISEAEAAEFSQFWRTDKIRSGRLANEWMSRAVERYTMIEKHARDIARQTNPAAVNFAQTP